MLVFHQPNAPPFYPTKMDVPIHVQESVGVVDPCEASEPTNYELICQLHPRARKKVHEFEIVVLERALIAAFEG